MDESTQTTDAQSMVEEPLCPLCFGPIDEISHFCPHCSAPVGDTCTLDPLGRIWAFCFFLLQLKRTPWGRKHVVFYVIVLPLLLCAMSIAATAVSYVIGWLVRTV